VSVGVEVDVRKATKYPPEAFISAMPVDLDAGENRVAEYAGFAPYIIVLQGFSFNRVDGLSFRLSVDEYADIVKLDNLASTRGLDFEESIKIPATRYATLKFTAPGSITAYQFRHRVVVLKPTVALKVMLGARLTLSEEELARRFEINRLLSLKTPEPLNLSAGVEELYTAAAKLTASGTVFKLSVPRGKKAVLLAVSASRPGSPGSAYLRVIRDDVEVMTLDLYCLPSLSYDALVRVVALDNLTAELDVKTPGDYYARLVYGLGRLTITEKVMWGLELTSDERAVAEREDLFSRVEAGVS
jgi:hypothetical protein